jgi:hypothetical protein
MKVIVPDKVSLATSGTSPVYVNSAWASGQSYSRGSLIRHTVSGVVKDFNCKWSHTSSSGNAPPNSWYWADRGPASTSGGYIYTTNVKHSQSPTWVSGQSVSQASTVFDPATNRDYISNILISSAVNTIRPSAAVSSTDETISSRWTDYGAANAWAPFDYENGSKLLGYDNSNNRVDPDFSVSVEHEETIDHVCLSGLSNVATLTLDVYTGSTPTLSQTVVKSLVPEATHFGIMRKSAVIPITPIAVGVVVSLRVRMTRHISTKPAALVVIVVGRGYEIAYTEWNVETSLLSFSKKERNETFGSVKFVKRGSAKAIKATCFVDPDIVTGDVVQQALSEWDGMPVFWDFNNWTSEYDRFRIFGFYSSMGIAIPAYTFESLSMTVEGLTD